MEFASLRDAPDDWPILLDVRNLTKVFGETRVLAGVNLTVRRGEIHGLLGQNGSGKSTLIKILAGYHAPESGAEMRFDGGGRGISARTRRVSKMGISFVHQDLALIPSLSVLDNLRLVDWSSGGGKIVNWGKERTRAELIWRPWVSGWTWTR